MAEENEVATLADGESSTDSMQRINQELSTLDKKLFALAKGEQLQQDGYEPLLHPGISELIKQGANVNAQDELGKTPLHYVVESKHGECEDLVNVLLNADAEIIPDQEEKTPIHQAINAKLDIVASRMIKALCSGLQRAQLSSGGQEHAKDIRKFLRNLVEAKLYKLVEKGNMNKTVVAILDFLANDKQGVSLLDRHKVGCTCTCVPGLSAFNLITLSGNQELAMHRLVKRMTDNKWVYLWPIYFFTALADLFLMTAFMLVSYEDIIYTNFDEAPSYDRVTTFFLGMSLILILILQCSRVTRYRTLYFRDKWNLLETCTAISLLVLLISVHAGTESKMYLWIIHSVVYFLLAARSLQHYAVSKYLLVYLTTMWNLRWRLANFIIVWGSTYLLFNGFFVLTLPYYSGGESDNQIFGRNETDTNQAITFKRICVLVLRTALNDEPTEEFFKGLELGHTIATWPLFILSIYSMVALAILLPILVAQISDEYTAAEQQATIYFLCNRARIVTSTERSIRGISLRFELCMKSMETRILHMRLKFRTFCTKYFGESRAHSKTEKEKSQDDLLRQLKELRFVLEKLKRAKRWQTKRN